MKIDLFKVLFATFCWVIGSSQVLQATSAPTPIEQLWSAQWIGPDLSELERNENVWIAYRKQFALDAIPSEMEARIAVDSKYWLWVNDQLVVREGGLKRGPTPEDTYYDEVELSAYLRPGQNTVAVLVWYWGKDGYSHKSSGQPGLVFEARSENEAWISDDSWAMLVHPAFEMTGDPHPNYRLPESNIRYRADVEPQSWWKSGYDDQEWSRAKEKGLPPVGPWGELVKRPIPQWKDYRLMPYVDLPKFPYESDGNPIVVNLPYNAQVTPYFDIAAPAGMEIEIRTDNYNGGGPPNVRAEYVTREGRQKFECLGWMNGHSVYYTFPKGVTIHDLKYRETGYDAEFSGDFESNDSALNQLWVESLRTLYITMRDTYMDCPDRERSQWWGDAVIEMEEAFYALDRRSDSLIRKGILELVHWQNPNGVLFSPVPAGKRVGELPTQMLASVGWYGFWTYYFQSGDIDTIRTAYPYMKRYMDLWELGEDGLVVQRSGAWTWGDWGKHKDMPILFNGWYYLALKGQYAMAEALGELDDLEGLEQKMASIRENFNRVFWTGSEYRSPEYEDETDERGHALAVLTGLAKHDQYAAIRKVFKTQFHASPYMEKYVLEALFVMGFAEDALSRTKMRYRAMLEDEYTTLYEGWGIGAEGFGGGTYNHAWSGGPLTLLSKYVAGVKPLSPGYSRFEIKPQLGGLNEVSATIPSAQGLIRVKVDAHEGRYDLVTHVPDGSLAVLHLPAASEYTYDGETINFEDMPSSSNYRLLSIGPEGLQIELLPGEHVFSCLVVAYQNLHVLVSNDSATK